MIFPMRHLPLQLPARKPFRDFTPHTCRAHDLTLLYSRAYGYLTSAVQHNTPHSGAYKTRSSSTPLALTFYTHHAYYNHITCGTARGTSVQHAPGSEYATVGIRFVLRCASGFLINTRPVVFVVLTRHWRAEYYNVSQAVYTRDGQCILAFCTRN